MNRTRVHILAANETLYAVARKYGVSPQDLIAANAIHNPAKVHAGKQLTIPASYERKSGSQEKPQKNGTGSLGKKKTSEYIVQDNDTFWKIAQRHGVRVEDLKRWNKVDENRLRVGTTLIVHAN